MAKSHDWHSKLVYSTLSVEFDIFNSAKKVFNFTYYLFYLLDDLK